MAYQLTALAAGVIFGLGLAVAQMVNPEKILGFLDVAGRWDPTLLVVMAGALAVATPAFRLILRTPAPRFASVFEVSTHRAVDARLVGGAVVFGVGWGLVGLCPVRPWAPSLSGVWSRLSSLPPWWRACSSIARSWTSPASGRARNRSQWRRGAD